MRIIWQCRRDYFSKNWPNIKWVLGHRGLRSMAPENTIASFQLAMQRGADGVEFDVMLSADSVPVVIHDDTVDRTTSASGFVSELDVDALQRLGIPTLQQTLECLPQGSIANVELKSSGQMSKTEFIQLVTPILDVYRQRLCLIISSFDTELLSLYRQENPHSLVSLLIGSEDELDPEYVSQIKPDALHLSCDLATLFVVQLAHFCGLKVAVWTLANGSDAKKWFKNMVDGVFVDAI